MGGPFAEKLGYTGRLTLCNRIVMLAKKKLAFLFDMGYYRKIEENHKLMSLEVDLMPDNNNTITFSLEEVREADMKRILLVVYDALKEKGYNPISQIVGYLLSEDPTYITTHNNARSLIRRIDRDELLKAMVRSYLGE